MADKVNPILGPKKKSSGDLKALHKCTADLHADVSNTFNNKGEMVAGAFNFGNFLTNLGLVIAEVVKFLPDFIPPVAEEAPKVETKKP